MLRNLHYSKTPCDILKRVWNVVDDNRLRQLIKEGKTHKECGVLLCRTTRSIENRVGVLKLCPGKKRIHYKWEYPEVQLLISERGKKTPVNKIVNMLSEKFPNKKRSYPGVLHKIHTMKI